MAVKKVVTKEELSRVAELRAKGCSRKSIAEDMNATEARIMYLISLLPKKTPIVKSVKRKTYYSAERKTFTDAMPNPFPKWWCDKNGLDHNFYRPEWKDI